MPVIQSIAPYRAGLPGLSLVVLLATGSSGCTVAKVDTDRNLHAQASACCPDEQSLPPPQPLKGVHMVELGPDTPHFDFGMGLAPFARLAFEPGSIARLQVRAYSRTSGTLFGGDGTFHYANVQLRFFDSAGAPLPFSAPQEPRIDVVGLTANDALVSEVLVPPDAAMVLVSTDTRRIGERGKATDSDAGGMFMVSAMFIWRPARPSQREFTLSPYGKVEFVSN
jgi:hypothetical protein